MTGDGTNGGSGADSNRETMPEGNSPGEANDAEERDREGRAPAQAVRDVVRGAGIVYSGLLVQVVVAFVAQVLAARYLSIGGFGGLTAGTAVLNVGGIVAGLGLGQGLTRYLPRIGAADRNRFVRVSVLLAAGIGVLLGAVVSLNAATIAGDVFGDPSVTVSVRVFGAAIPASAVLSVAVGGIRGQKRPRYRVYVQNLTRPIVRFGLVVVAVVVGADQLGFALAYAIPFAVATALALYLLWRALPTGENDLEPRAANGEGGSSDGEWESGDVSEFLRYSIPFVVSGAAGFVYRSIDIFLILYFLDSRAVGVYGVAYAAARLVLMFSTAFNYLGTPVASELDAAGDDEGMLCVHRLMLRWLVVASVPALVPFVLFPAGFITDIYRPNYATGAGALAVLAVGFAIHNVLSAQANLIQARGESRVFALNSGVAAAVNVGLNLLLIPRYGILGAAVATVASYLVMDLMLSAEFYYILGRYPVSRSVTVPVLLAVPPFAATALVSSAVPAALPWIVLASAAFGIVYLGVVLVGQGTFPEEVMLLRSIEERFGLSLGPITRMAERFVRS